VTTQNFLAQKSNRPLVYSLASRILKDRFAAQEVTIDVYMQIHRQAADYDPEKGAPSAWLLTLTRSRAIDRLRMEVKRRTREELLETTEAISALTASPEEESATAELRRAVQAALLALAPEQRQIIEIAYYSGLSQSEIAATLGQPPGTVKTRIRSGMMALRETLRPLTLQGEP